MSNTDIVRESFDACRNKDEGTMARLLADGFVFTSPQGDHINKIAFLERCFPTAERFASQKIVELVDAGASGVFITNEYELKTGGRYRNTEFIMLRDCKIVETQVFFGGQV